MEKKLFSSVAKEAIKINGILYAPPNLLRLNVYKELSRPEGEVARWENRFHSLSLGLVPLKPREQVWVGIERIMRGSMFIGSIPAVPTQAANSSRFLQVWAALATAAAPRSAPLTLGCLRGGGHGVEAGFRSVMARLSPEVRER